MASTKEVMKKLEEFMIQQTQSTSDLKGAIVALQAKQSALEESIVSQSRNKKHVSEADGDEGTDGDNRFEDSHELSLRRGKGIIQGGTQTSKGTGFHTPGPERRKRPEAGDVIVQYHNNCI
ncbi:unnamed protein product [Lactuca virosa]|uniref:Uncharacterized protein n=1 Tax=Lactuca virosa TaxID=75947 RepID=A0AAU9LUQ4_9ASTR|nr:unnamed protein product [Lactuca virosa]